MGEIRVFFRSETNIALNDSGGDTVRLLAPDGRVLDEYEYPSAAYDQAWARDEGGAWHEDWLPSPGEPNQPPPTPTPTPSPSPIPDGLELNEFLPRPESDWNEDGEADTDDEYIEIINRSGQVFDLTGFELDDIEGGSSSYVLTGTLAVGEIRVFFRSETNIALNDSGGDTVRLLAPDGSILDEYEYRSAAYDQAWARDEGGAWHEDWLPSPGEPNQPPPTPRRSVAT